MRLLNNAVKLPEAMPQLPGRVPSSNSGPRDWGGVGRALASIPALAELAATSGWNRGAEVGTVEAVGVGSKWLEVALKQVLQHVKDP